MVVLEAEALKIKKHYSKASLHLRAILDKSILVEVDQNGRHSMSMPHVIPQMLKQDKIAKKLRDSLKLLRK